MIKLSKSYYLPIFLVLLCISILWISLFVVLRERGVFVQTNTNQQTNTKQTNTVNNIIPTTKTQESSLLQNNSRYALPSQQ